MSEENGKPEPKEDPLAEMVFDTCELKRVPVRIGDKRYILRQASGNAAIQYRNAVTRAGRFDPDTGKFVGSEGLAEAEPILVSACLYNAQPDGSGGYKEAGNVSVAVVKSWPYELMHGMFNRIKAITPMLDETDKAKGEEVKKPPADSTDGSESADSSE